MEFEQLQQEMNAIIEDVKKAVELPLDAEGKLPPGTQLSLEDLEKLLERTQGVVDRLNQRAVDLAAQKGLSREEMASFVEDPKNFSQEEWKAMQGMKQQIDQFQKTLMRTVVAGHREEIETKGPRAKQPGSTKRNWIPL